MWTGSVVSIYVASSAAAPTRTVEEARAVAGKGLEGDRYFDGRGTWSAHPGSGREVTLIESEALDALESEAGPHFAPGAHRRNVVTRGVPLNHLVGHDFRIGEVVLRGTRLCEPCEHLEKLTQPGIKMAALHRSGLRADVIQEGSIRIGDVVEEKAESGSAQLDPIGRHF
jgi:MOSC domain-containing protein YiiM